MADSINDGGPAFPVVDLGGTGMPRGPKGEPASAGMTLRDYFAAKAMRAFIGGASGVAFGSSVEGTANCDLYAEIAYGMADAMLKARQS